MIDSLFILIINSCGFVWIFLSIFDLISRPKSDRIWKKGPDHLGPVWGNFGWFLGFLDFFKWSPGPPFERIKIKVVLMIQNLIGFRKSKNKQIQKVTALHLIWNPPAKMPQDDLVLLIFMPPNLKNFFRFPRLRSIYYTWKMRHSMENGFIFKKTNEN